MMARRHIVVIGAGVIGLAAAWRLAEQGVSVTVVEAERPGAGTSSTSFAWVNASSKVDAGSAYFTLNAAAVREHRSLGPAATPAGWFRPTGDLEIADGPDEAEVLRRKVEALTARGYAAEMVSRQGLDALEPGTRWPERGAAAFYPEEGWVDVGRMIGTLLGRARDAGATVVTGDPAREVLRPGGAARGVRLASAQAIEADGVVVALGRWTTEFAARLGLDVPLVAAEPLGSKALGLLAGVKLLGTGPRCLLHSRDVNWSPLGDRRALLASDAGDAAVAADRSAAVVRSTAERLLADAVALNPLFGGATLDDVKLGIRALPSDNVTICGPIRGVPGLTVVVTHSGVTLSPLLGRLVAAEIMTGREDPMLAPFRPNRFLATGA